MHSLRTRQMGSKALVDVHIQVAPHVSVSEGHRISDEVSLRLIDEIDVVSQVLVHIDPENDVFVNVSYWVTSVTSKTSLIDHFHYHIQEK